MVVEEGVALFFWKMQELGVIVMDTARQGEERWKGEAKRWIAN
jgi:hypothetical protein